MSEVDHAEEFRELKDLFRRRLVNDRASAAALEGLQAQNDELLRQITGQSLVPFLRGVRRIVERLSDQIATESGEEYSFAESVLDELLESIGLLDVGVIAQSGPLQPEFHNSVAVAAAEVGEPTVVEVVRPGFHRAGAVLIPADVVVAMPEQQ